MSDVLEVLKQKFTSGNQHPVERATITREEYNQLLILIAELKIEGIVIMNDILEVLKKS